MKIAIGGMIGSGKSTLTKNLAKAMSFKYMEEYEKSDEVFNTLLKWLYEGVDDVEMLLQVYFLHNHWKNQNEYDEGADLIVDRDIIEHWIFAQENLKEKPEVNNMYNGLFHAYMNSHHKPDLYVILDIDWATFKQRVRKRGRKQEIENFDANADYFMSLIRDYVKKLKAQCDIYNIPYIVVDVNGLSEKETLSKVLDEVNNVV